MSKRNIKLGEICIAGWSLKNKRMFSCDYYYDKNDQFWDKSCEKDVKKCKPDEVVLLPNKQYTLIIDYPVSINYKTKFKTGKSGMTRLQLVDKICKHYRKMYAEEDISTKIPSLLGKDGGNAPLLNRQETNGKYGIWGHCIGDLILVNCDIDGKGNITLGVDS